MTIAELVAKISLKGGKETVATMQGLLKSTIATKAALLGAATALYKMSEAARNSAMYMDQYQLNTGLSITQLQQLSFKASQAGVSMAELGGTIQKLQQMNANARLGYGWDPILTRFGLTPGQDPVTQLDKISAALKRMGASNPAEAHALASKVGLSDSMYYALMKMGTEQMNKQLILTQKEQQALVKLNQQWNKFWFYLKQIIIKIQALSAEFSTGLVRILTRAVQGFYELFSRIYKVIEASDKLKVAVVALAAVFAAAFAQEILLLTAVALILEDIFTYFEGGDSITGEIVEWCKQSEAFMELWSAIKDIFDIFIGLIKMAYTGWKELLAALNDAGFFQDILNGICDMLRFIIDSLAALTKIPGVKWAMKRAGFGDIVDKADERLNKDMGFLGGMSDKILSGIGMLNPIGAFAGAASHFNTHVYIQSTGDAALDARNAMSVEKEIKQSQGQQANLSNGGRNGAYRYPPHNK